MNAYEMPCIMRRLISISQEDGEVDLYFYNKLTGTYKTKVPCPKLYI